MAPVLVHTGGIKKHTKEPVRFLLTLSALILLVGVLGAVPTYLCIFTLLSQFVSCPLKLANISVTDYFSDGLNIDSSILQAHLKNLPAY